MKFSSDEKLKYFKDERWGISDVFASSEKGPKKTNLKRLLTQTKRTIEAAEGKRPFSSMHMDFIKKVSIELSNGPDWCQAVQNKLNEFLREGLLGTLKQLVAVVEDTARAGSPQPGSLPKSPN